MFCTSCGKEQEGSPEYCTNCGARMSGATDFQPGGVFAAGANYSGFWRRVAAAIIDGVLLGIVGQLVIVMISFGTDDTTSIYVAYYGISVIIDWLYFALMESSSSQATLGKMALSIVVTDGNGNRISFARATVRTFGKIVTQLTIVLGIISLITIAFTKKKQALHDMVAGTLVVAKKK